MTIIIIKLTHNLHTQTKSSVYKAKQFSNILKLTFKAALCILKLVTTILLLLLVSSGSTVNIIKLVQALLFVYMGACELVRQQSYKQTCTCLYIS